MSEFIQGLLEMRSLHGFEIVSSCGVAKLGLLLLEGLDYHGLGDYLRSLHLDVDYLFWRHLFFFFLNSDLLISVIFIILLLLFLLLLRCPIFFSELRKQVLASFIYSLWIAYAQGH